MDYISSREADNRSCIHEIQPPLWNLKVHYRVLKNQSLVSILFQVNSVDDIIILFLTSILMLSFHIYLGLPSSLFP
jgi:hypothetical protein